MAEIIRRFELQSQIKPFHRCMSCNGLIKKVEKEEIEERLEPKTRKFFTEFFICSDCQKIYWRGSHFINMEQKIELWIQAAAD